MKRIGVSGHQKREGADWAWTRRQVAETLRLQPAHIEGWSSLAIGADQLFAQEVLDGGGSIVTVVPGPWYERCFEGDGLAAYRELLQLGRAETLEGNDDEEAAFLEAGIMVADNAELLIAIWDGKPAKGKGGTADIVEHALAIGKPVLRIDPIKREVTKLTRGSR